MQFLALWARRLSWSEVGRVFHTSWEKVFHSVEWMVQWGLEHRKLTRIRSLGIDEVAWRKGHEYLTLVYQIDERCQRLLWVGKDCRHRDKRCSNSPGSSGSVIRQLAEGSTAVSKWQLVFPHRRGRGKKTL